MVEDKYMIGEIDNNVFIKVEGNATMKNSKTLSDFLDELLKGEAKNVSLELSKCNYVDSTFLGLIAKYAMRIKKQWNNSLIILNATNMVNNSLKQTGVDKFIVSLNDEFNVHTEEIQVTDFEDKSEKAKHILESHKILMDLNEENEKVFKNVVDMLEKDMNK